MKLSGWLTAAAAAVVLAQGLSVKSCIEQSALARARADSVAAALEARDRLLAERATVDQARQADTLRLHHQNVELRRDLSAARAAARERTRRLREHLAADSLLRSDTLVVATVEAVEREAAACGAALTVCDSATATFRLMILQRDSTVRELRADRDRLNQLFQRETRRARPGVLRRVWDGLPFVAAGAVIGIILVR